jgi:hypothetical protein
VIQAADGRFLSGWRLNAQQLQHIQPRNIGRSEVTTDLQLGPYLDLLTSFLSRSIGVSDFETRYLDLFKQDDVIRPEEVFDVLDSLFSDVDAYSPHPAEDEIGEEQLRREAGEAYERLRAYAQADPSVG